MPAELTAVHKLDEEPDRPIMGASILVKDDVESYVRLALLQWRHDHELSTKLDLGHG
jgi:hypothetical protein